MTVAIVLGSLSATLGNCFLLLTLAGLIISSDASTGTKVWASTGILSMLALLNAYVVYVINIGW